MTYRFRLWRFLICVLWRRGHYFCPWYRKQKDVGFYVQHNCRDCGYLERRPVAYDVWQSVQREDAFL